MDKRKNTGFTLIELLAVIVILALLVLIAAPAVTDIMQKSAKSNFKNEAASFVTQMNNAYTSKMANSFSTATKLNDKSIHNITVGAGTEAKAYAYLCMTLEDLVNEKYTSKNLGTSYGGYIQMFVPNSSTEKSITYVNITNGRYFVQGQMDDITQDSYLPSQTSVGTAPKGGKVADGGTACPESVTAVPTAKNA